MPARRRVERPRLRDHRHKRTLCAMWQGDGGVAIPSADVLGHGAFEEMPIRPLNLLGSASTHHTADWLRAGRKFSCGIKLISPVQTCPQKYSVSLPTQITSRTAAVPPLKRGVSRSSRTRGGMRWMQAALLTRARALRTVKSCGPDASTPASSLREEAQTTVTKEPDRRGEHEATVKTIACGNAGLFRWTCGD
jgi:hypothetical protein